MSLFLNGTPGHATSSGGAPITVNVTTTVTDCLIVVFATYNLAAGGITSVSGSTLGAFNFRALSGTAVDGTGYYYKAAPSALTAEVITVTAAGGQPNFWVVDAFGISGANTSSPFDGSVVISAAGPDPLTISTTNSNTMVLGCFAGPASPTSGAGYTQISGADFILSEYQIFTSPQTNLSVTMGTGAGTGTRCIADAIVQAGSGSGDTLFGGQRVVHMRRKPSIGWGFDHYRRILRPNRALWILEKLPRNFQKVA